MKKLLLMLTAILFTSIYFSVNCTNKVCAYERMPQQCGSQYYVDDPGIIPPR